MTRRRGGCLSVFAFIALICIAVYIITHMNPEADFTGFLAEWTGKIRDAWRAAWQVLTGP